MKESEKKRIFTILSSNIELEILSTLPIIKDDGDADFIIPLAKLLLLDISNELKRNIRQIFLELKDNTAVAPIMNIIQNKTFGDESAFFRSLCWGLKLDFTDYFNTFIDLFISSPFEPAFDYFTTIEIMLQDYFDKISIESSNKAIDKIKGKISSIDASKKDLTVELIHLLQHHIKQLKSNEQ
jgi:hypothetical protein